MRGSDDWSMSLYLVQQKACTTMQQKTCKVALQYSKVEEGRESGVNSSTNENEQAQHTCQLLKLHTLPCLSCMYDNKFSGIGVGLASGLVLYSIV